MKTTAIAPSNIAFIKYWGRKDEVLRLPTNGSISMNLSNLLTTTTVEFSPDFTTDSVVINGKEEGLAGNRAIEHLNRIRKLADSLLKVKVVSQNNFPMSTGLSSSASGFAALTVAAAQAAGLSLSQRDLSILARQASGSACRSIPDGFVEWLSGESSETSYSVSLFPPEYWNIVDVVAIINTNIKEVATTEGMKSAFSSPFLHTRLKGMKSKIAAVKKLIEEKKFSEFGVLIEQEAIELHAVMMTSTPSLFYLLPETTRIMRLVRKWRSEGLEVYFTINTGHNIHLLCEKKNEDMVASLLQYTEGVKHVIINTPSLGARLTDRHLF